MDLYTQELDMRRHEWVVQRLKGNKLHIFRVPTDTKFPLSYSMFRITNSQRLMLLQQGTWVLMDEDEYTSKSLSLPENIELKNKYNELAKFYVPKEIGQEVVKKVHTDIPGTSCLIRTSTRSCIQIAYRKNDDKTSINRVCISNTRREEFFETCRITNDPNADKYYKIRNGYKYFSYWDKFMDEEYKRQVGSN